MKALKHIRLADYKHRSNGYYFVTICTNNRMPYLVEKTKSVVAQFVEHLPMSNSGVKLDYYTIMPDHIHLILVLNECNIELGEIIRQFKARTSKHSGFRLWQPSYYEHVIRNEKTLSSIREYIINNPEVERVRFEMFYKNTEPDKSGNYKKTLSMEVCNS